MTDKDKDYFLEMVWNAMLETGTARCKRVHDRIPDFYGSEEAKKRRSEEAKKRRSEEAKKRRSEEAGSEEAARLVFSLPAWQNAKAVKSNPERPQRPLRQRALEEGKVLYMAVPRLRSEQCLIELDPTVLNAPPAKAATIKGAFTYGRLVHFEEMRPVDLVISGSVAVDRQGTRIGKGGGFADLEYGLAAAAGVVKPETPVVTTVHCIQLLNESLPWTHHDVPLDYLATPEEVIRCQSDTPKPQGIYWEDLNETKIAQIPLLGKLWRAIGEG